MYASVKVITKPTISNSYIKGPTGLTSDFPINHEVRSGESVLIFSTELHLQRQNHEHFNQQIHEPASI